MGLAFILWAPKSGAPFPLGPRALFQAFRASFAFNDVAFSALVSLGLVPWRLTFPPANTRPAPFRPFIYPAFGLEFHRRFLGTVLPGEGLLLFWQLVLIGALGWFWKSPHRSLPFRALVTGILTAIGLYVSFLLLLTCFFVSLVLAYLCLSKGRKGFKNYLLFLAGFLPPALPMIGLMGFSGISSKVIWRPIWSGAEGSISWLHQFATFFSYPASFFFGSIDQSYWNFGPLWGGFLNPLLGAGFFLGLTRLRDPFKLGLEGALILGLLLSLPPLLLGTTVEFAQDFQILPFLMWIVTMGSASLAQDLKPRSRWPVIIVFLLLSMALDGWHLFGVFHQWSLTKAMTPGLAIKSPERYKAFQVLEQEQPNNEGPGLIFSDFVSDIYDQSLLVSTYPFNAARNPRLDPLAAKWAGILCELHYEAPLQARFPKTLFFLLSNPNASEGPLWPWPSFPWNPGPEAGRSAPGSLSIKSFRTFTPSCPTRSKIRILAP